MEQERKPPVKALASVARLESRVAGLNSTVRELEGQLGKTPLGRSLKAARAEAVLALLHARRRIA